MRALGFETLMSKTSVFVGVEYQVTLETVALSLNASRIVERRKDQRATLEAWNASVAKRNGSLCRRVGASIILIIGISRERLRTGRRSTCDSTGGRIKPCRLRCIRNANDGQQ
jgi:hypothetical protein